eukprot:2278811-Amphidinium_carterae.1
MGKNGMSSLSIAAVCGQALGSRGNTHDALDLFKEMQADLRATSHMACGIIVDNQSFSFGSNEL